MRTTIGAIATGARTAPSNVYVYFPSKLDVALAVYEPWLKSQVQALEKAVAAQKSGEAKVRRLVDGLLRRIPEDEGGHTTILVQALSAARPNEPYNPELLHWIEGRIAGMLRRALGVTFSEPESMALARGLMLVFDGVALRRNLSIATIGPDLVDTMVRLILAQARRSGELDRADSSPRTVSPSADRGNERGSASSSNGGGGTARRRTRRQLIEP
jgi:AcrR family transcriptional regulator